MKRLSLVYGWETIASCLRALSGGYAGDSDADPTQIIASSVRAISKGKRCAKRAHDKEGEADGQRKGHR